MGKDYIEIEAFLKNLKSINPKPYANETKCMPLYKLLRDGSVEISPFDFDELKEELIRLSFGQHLYHGVALHLHLHAIGHLQLKKS